MLIEKEQEVTAVIDGSAAAPVAVRGHLPALDGIRGVAILLVLAVHLITMGGGTPITRIERILPQITLFGWSGVNLFFVLSGFLITGILYDSKGRAHGLRNFYVRRALRIFPLYYGVMIVYFLFFARLFPTMAGHVRANAQYQPWIWLYAVNWGICLTPHGFHDLGHLWSLAVEEHFYLLWPFIIRACSRRTSIKLCVAMMIGAAVFRFAWIGAGRPMVHSWVLDPSHFDALALGGLIALVARGPGGLSSLRVPALVGAFLGSNILAFLFGFSHGALHVHWRFQMYGWTSLVVLFGSALVLIVLAPRASFLGRVFQSRFLRFFGMYSYGIYIYHGILYHQFEIWFPTQKYQQAFGSYIPAVLLHGLLATLVTVGVAVVSYHGFEKPILGLKDRFPVETEKAAETATPHRHAAHRAARSTTPSGR